MNTKKEQKELTIIIPAYQSEKTIKNTILSLIKYFPQAEIIIINDGSTDNTKEIKDIFQEQIVYLENETNKGKGYSLRKGFTQAQGKYIIFTDADLPFKVQDIERVFQKLKQGNAIVIARREEFYNDVFYKKLFRPFLYLILYLLFGFKYLDTQCGLKGFNTQAGKKILSASITNEFAIDIEILYLARKLNYPITEIMVKQELFSASTFRLMHMFRMFTDLFKIKFHYYEIS